MLPVTDHTEWALTNTYILQFFQIRQRSNSNKNLLRMRRWMSMDNYFWKMLKLYIGLCYFAMWWTAQTTCWMILFSYVETIWTGDVLLSLFETFVMDCETIWTIKAMWWLVMDLLMYAVVMDWLLARLLLYFENHELSCCKTGLCAAQVFCPPNFGIFGRNFKFELKISYEKSWNFGDFGYFDTPPPPHTHRTKSTISKLQTPDTRKAPFWRVVAGPPSLGHGIRQLRRRRRHGAGRTALGATGSVVPPLVCGAGNHG